MYYLSSVTAHYFFLLMTTSISSDGSTVAFDSPKGPRLYQLDPFGSIQIPQACEGPTTLIRLLRPSHVTLVAIAYAQDPRTVAIYPIALSIPIFESTMSSSVVEVYMNRAHLVILTADGNMTIYSMPQATILRRVHIGSGAVGLCVLSESSWLIVLGVSTRDGNCDLPRAAECSVGAVLVYDINSHETIAVFEAHKLEVIAIASFERYIATALATGTILRVFSLELGTATCIRTWRRGRNAATVTQLLFSEDGSMVACASSHTIHLFRMENVARDTEGAWRLKPRVPRYVKAVANVQPRSFAVAHVKETIRKSDLLQVSRDTVWLAVSSRVYSYRVETCQLVSSHLLLDA